MNTVIQHRRNLHKIPELAFNENKTAQYIEDFIKSLPNISIWSRIGNTGIVAEIGNGKKCIAIRADMDALPIEEETYLSFKSETKGLSHACGYDGHIAILLSVIEETSKISIPENCKIRFIFQPAEEQDLGALEMIKGGCMKDVDEIYGLHIWNSIPLGKVALTKGPIMAGTDRILISVQGKGGHAAAPNKTDDPIFKASCLINQLYGLSSRILDPCKDHYVFSICKINAGTAFNVIPDQVTIEGTFRFLHNKTRELFQKSVKEYCIKFDAKADFFPMAPVTRNNKCDKITEAFSKHCEVIDNYYTMAGEDFSYYLHYAKGAYALLGGGKNIPHHSSKFDFDEKVLEIGVNSFMSLIKDFCDQNKPKTGFDFTNTPQYKSEYISEKLGFETYLKIECYNPIRSFKGRGATLFINSLGNNKDRLVTASVGNFGQAMALTCREQKIPLTIYASVNAAKSKLNRMKKLGAEVIQFGKDFDEAKTEALRFCKEQNIKFIEDGSEPLIAKGCESLGEEIAKLNPDYVFVPVGNGALIIGVTRGIKRKIPNVKVIGVCAKDAPCMYHSFKEKKPCNTNYMETKADCIGVRVAIPEAVYIINRIVDDMILVTDEEMKKWMQILEIKEGVVAELGAVSGLAAVEKYYNLKNKKVVVIITGGNR
jgi:amidohydrolase